MTKDESPSASQASQAIVRKSPVPIVVDLGRASPKKIRKLIDGGGPLPEEVAEVVAQLREQLGSEADGKELVPVVVVYSRKKRKDKTLLDLLL